MIVTSVVEETKRFSGYIHGKLGVCTCASVRICVSVFVPELQMCDGILNMEDVNFLILPVSFIILSSFVRKYNGVGTPEAVFDNVHC
jgi:hypothetical protein